MAPQLFGYQHILYIVFSLILGSLGLLFAKKYARSEKAQKWVLKGIAACLLVAIVTNRISMAHYFGGGAWYKLIPDSFCGMTSLTLALAVLFGKRDNVAYHFLWLLGFFGGVSTVIYASFVDQHTSFFFLPTISGLLHHSLCALMVVALLLFHQIDITYKKWYCTLFGFTAYLTLGAFLMHTFDLSDAFHIAEPLIDGTPLTAWVMAPIYAVCYAAILAGIELYRKHKRKATEQKEK
jgi:hypothetical protein